MANSILVSGAEDVLKKLSDFDFVVLPGWEYPKNTSAPSKLLQALLSCFAALVSDKEIAAARRTAVPKSTQTDTLWCIALWNKWLKQRNTRTSEKLEEELSTLSPVVLQKWLCRFVLEVRKKDGENYPPETLYHIICGIFCFLKQNGQPHVDFHHRQAFCELRTTLDAEMKRLKRAGIGAKKRKAEPLTHEEEEMLWSSGVLGHHSPKALLNTVFFFNGICFALRSGAEHRQLRFRDCQIKVIRKPGEKAYLHYTEHVSKNNQGGLKGRKVEPKEVIQHENLEDPARCPVKTFELYNSLCPFNRPDDVFYLKPLSKPKPKCWFAAIAIGHNILQNLFKSMCEEANIQGLKTNHSLRVTTATRLYQAGIDEQLIMERTGHRSIGGVRCYKRTSDDQQLELSEIVAAKKVHVPTSGNSIENKQVGV